MNHQPAVPIPLLSLGFRPFFLLGCLSGLLALLAWLWALTGTAVLVQVTPLWHAHEMVHGFALAIVIGFLFTSTQNWTGIRGIHGRKLLATVVVWSLGRLVFLLPTVPPSVVAVVDLAFLPVVGTLLIPYLGIASQRRNAIFLVLLALLWLSSAFYHLEQLEIWPGLARRGLYLGVHIIIVMIVIIGGRVIPFFTERAVPGYRRRQWLLLDRSMMAAALLFALSHWLDETSRVTHAAAFIAGVCIALRMASWFDRRILKIPILWILYLGYGWVAIGYLLASVEGFGVIAPSVALHALTVGGISTMIIGMISRVSLGHTGRPLVAARTTIIAYLLVQGAALIRVGAPMLFPEHYLTAMITAGAAWMLGFAIFIFVYAPILVAPRPDGRPG